MKLKIVYWSGSGNTAAMAEAVFAGARESGNDVELFEVGKTTPGDALEADSLALGCPAMGAETLEEEEMEPFVSSLESAGLTGKKVFLFGSYDWGDGEWMRNWGERMTAAGAVVSPESVICQGGPDEQTVGALRAIGALLARGHS